MNKEKVQQRILELQKRKIELEKSKVPIWLYLVLWMIPIIGWMCMPLPSLIKKTKILALEKEIRELDLWL